MKKTLLSSLALLAMGSLALVSAQVAPPGADKPKEFDGEFNIVPASAPAMVLEVVDSATAAGSSISINHPNKADNQKWIITAKGDGYYSIRAAHSKDLVIAAPVPDDRDGTNMKVETDKGEPSQLWAVQKNENGTVTLLSKASLVRSFGNLGGGNNPGNRIVSWSPINHPNLQWKLVPVAK